MATQIAKQKGLLNEILCQKWMCQNIKIEDINRKRNDDGKDRVDRLGLEKIYM